MQEAQFPGKLVNVPQGKSGRFTRATLAAGITGLYTNAFTTCNILAFIGKDKLLLIHADLQTDPFDEAQWIEDELQELILIYKPSYEEVVTVNLRPRLQERYGEKLKVLAINEAHESVHLSFDRNEEGFHPNIRTYPMDFTPPNLIRHPFEQQLVAVQKIGQIIGIRAKNHAQKKSKKQSQRSTKKTLNIFDGAAWVPIENSELKVDVSHPMTEQEMRRFSAGDDYMTTAEKLSSVIHEYKIPFMGDEIDLVMPIAFEIESYLNNFDAPRLFIRNIRWLFDKKLGNNVFLLRGERSEEDQKLIESVRKETSPEKIIGIFESYKATARDTPFKAEVMEAFSSQLWRYNARMVYVRAAQEREALTKRFTSLLEKAQPHIQKNIEAALSLFREALKIASQCFLKNDKAYARAHWNVGRALQRLENGVEAQFFIQTALTLSTPYPVTHGDLIEKAKKALKECDDIIKKQTLPSPAMLARKES